MLFNRTLHLALALALGGFAAAAVPETGAVDRDAARTAVLEHLMTESGLSSEECTVLFLDNGLLSETLVAAVQRNSWPLWDQYFVRSDGSVALMTLEETVQAHIEEGITVGIHGSMEEIGRGIIALSDRFGAVVISSLDDIPGYDGHPLDSDLEGVVRAPWILEGDDGAIYWICCTHSQTGGIVSRYRIAFRNGRIANPTEVLVLGRGVGDVAYIE